jgi:glycosyltransferase involved in cell wall biosynthesis
MQREGAKLMRLKSRLAASSPPPMSSDHTILPQRIAFLGDYPPRACGIATFTKDLSDAVAAAAPRSLCYVAAVNDRAGGYHYSDRVRVELQENDLDSYRRAADFLNFNNAEVICIQHEFGIYGGPAGSHLLTLLRELRMPVVTTLHTLLTEPDEQQKEVMDELTRRSDRLAVMARKGVEILRDVYAVPVEKVDVIPHGIPDLPFVESSVYKEAFGVQGRTVLLTFGLLSPGKGIESVLEALPSIIAKHRDVVYIVLGATHPQLLAKEGESYRLGLERMAEEKGVKEHVIFYNRFVSLEDLKEFIGATDIYITPYLSQNQITSGTLAYVFGAGKPVVSTPYWHAQELLAEDRGVLIPFRSPGALAEAVCGLLEDPVRRARICRDARRIGREMIWPAVAQSYLESFQRARAERKAPSRAAFGEWTLSGRHYDLPTFRLDHLVRMTDNTGIFQHAIYTVPNFEEGYCSDDNARAFILCNLLGGLGDGVPAETIERLAGTYLAFLAAALSREGNFRNLMSFGREWLEPGGSEDSHARALWAVGSGSRRSKQKAHLKLCRHLFRGALPAALSFTASRGWAFSLLGLDEYLRAVPGDAAALECRERLTENLLQLWRRSQGEQWPWFEKSVTYDNARLCQSLILSGRRMARPDLLEIGLQSLQWLVSLQLTETGWFRPIGSPGYFPQGGERALYDQQPVEANAMVAACLEAFRATREPSWMREAKRAFEWFLGRNDHGLALYDSSTGGCFDGLHQGRVNENQGAESTLAFHLSLAKMRLAEQAIPEAG